MTTLSGKTALVTGAGSGIGKGIAAALAQQGVNLVLCGRRKEPLERTASEIRQAGSQGVLVVPTDVSDEAQVKALVAKTQDTFGAVDILVNNAGIGGGAEIHQHEVAEWDRVIAVNLRGPFLLARAVLPEMRSRGGGHIINISSESGLEYYPGDGAYGVSKHALNALGEYIQRENQDFDIRVDTICPGMVVTEMTENSAGLNHALCLEADDIAELVLWLLTRRSNIKIGRPILIQTMANPWE